MFCQRCGGATEERDADGRLRPVCTVCGFITYLDPKVAVAVVIERDGALLLGKRGPGTRAPGSWSFPAGFVERGEQIEDAAIREVHEEVGLEITLGPLLGVYSAPGETVVLIAYLAATAEGEATAGDDLVDVAWFAPEDVPERAFVHDDEIIAAWRRTAAQSRIQRETPLID